MKRMSWMNSRVVETRLIVFKTQGRRNMPQIMFYINAINGGGAERIMVNLAKCFSENGYDTLLVTSFRDTWEYSVADSVKRLTLKEQEIKQSHLKRNFSRISKLRKICEEEKSYILVSFMEEPNFRAILATRDLPVRTLCFCP